MVKAVVANREDLVKFTNSWAQKDLDSILALYADAVKTRPDFMKFFDILKWVQAPLPNYRNTIVSHSSRPSRVKSALPCFRPRSHASSEPPTIAQPLDH